MAQRNNKNSSKENRVWAKVIRKLAVQEDHKRIHKVAEALFKEAEAGNIAAVKELGDRLDGKSTEYIHQEGETTVKVITGIDTDDKE